MKTYLLFVLLFIAGFTAQAQKFINNTPCKLVITPACYDPLACVGGPCGIAPIVVPPFGTAPLVRCACQPPKLPGYIVCYAACPNICTNVGNQAGPCPAWPVPAILGPCPNCDNLPHTIKYTPMGDLLIQ